MKKSHFILLGVVSTFITIAFAEMPTPGGPPSMEFHTIPIQGAPTLEHKVTPYRLFDKMIVTVWDPIQCGQKPVNPAFSIQGNKLFLSYALSNAPEGAKSCTLVSEFDILNVPHRDLEVQFAGGPEPYVVAKLKKCPFSKPKSEDIWECLLPETP
jgi:hypothetical protein